jgi:uncharacterized membrane protein
MMQTRNDAIVNGALMAVGALAVLDNIVVHWGLELHRAIPGPHALKVEWMLLALGVLLFVVGLRRELRARRGVTRASPA